ncbi:MAG: glycosidase, partial [Bacteroidales bacterium]
MPVAINRRDNKFYPDATRVIARFLYVDDQRSANTIHSVIGMSESEVVLTLNKVLRDYSMRHRNITKIFEKHFRKISHLLTLLKVDPGKLSFSRKILIGSYFTMEYSVESAAFFNPSIIEHPDQSEVGLGEKRVILSFRATGEGHISSIVFRTGILDSKNNMIIEPVGKMLEEAEHIQRHIYNKESFRRKLEEMHDFHAIIPSGLVLDKLNGKFTYDELLKCIEETRKTLHLASDKEILFNQIIWLASSHYELEFSLDTNISERVIFPVSSSERNGIEDARFVKFKDEDGSITYYATYTAYNGIAILPKLLD